MKLSELMASAETTGQKAYAKRLLNEHVREQEAKGHNPTMVLAGLRAAITRMSGPKDDPPQTLVDRFMEIQESKNAQWRYDKMRGWNRSVTEHCKKRPHQEQYIRRAIKAQITKRGGDTNILTW
jgi:ParB-like chromosome segregation protein Spo0J